MRKRVWTALIAIAVILSALHAPSGLPFVAVLLVGFGFGLAELSRLLGWGWKSLTTAWVIAALSFILIGQVAASEGLVFGITGLGFLLGSLAVMWRKVDRPHPMAWLGTGWLMMPVICLCVVHSWWHGGGANPITLYFISLWAGDSLALGVGKSLGKTLIAPSISEGKTWEGAVGAFAGSLSLALIFSPAFDVRWETGAAIGVMVGVLGTLGDLFESWMKRRQSLKDSGGVMPGHGGMLDRVDSMMMTSIPASMILVFMEPQMFHVKQMWEGLLR